MDVTRPSWTTQVVPLKDDYRRWNRRLKVIFGVVTGMTFFAILPLLIALASYFYFQFVGVVMPGVRVGEVPLGGLTLYEAQAELDRVWNTEYRITAVDSTDTSRAWEVSPSEFGLSVDAQANAASAFALGRGEDPIAGFAQMLQGYTDGVVLHPWVSLDIFAAREGLERWAAMVEIQPVEGSIWFEGGEVVSTSGKAGKVLDIDESLRLVGANPSEMLLEYRFVPLIMKSVEPVIADVADAAAEAEGFLGSGLTLTAYDPVTDEHFAWSPTREEIASWLIVERGVSSFAISIDDEKLIAYIAGLNTSLGEERFIDSDKALSAIKLGLQDEHVDTLLIQYRPTSYIVQPGDNLVSIGFDVGMPYWKLQETNPSLAINGLDVGKAIAIPPKDAMLELPLVSNKRIVISIPEQRMWVYQDGTMIWKYVVSTGIDRSPTLPGIFQVQSHSINAYASIWDLYMPHFLGIYKATPDLVNGIHGLPLLSGGTRLWADVLGQPASYGCIILNLQAAEQLYNWAEDGVVVEIKG